MESLKYIVDHYLTEILIGIVAISLINFIVIIIQTCRLSSMKKKYKMMLKGNKVDIESMLISNNDKVDNVINTNKEIINEINRISEELKQTYSKASMYRYDAFSGLSGRLSFVYVLLNQVNCGFILNGIYSNEGHYLYIKEVINGKTDKELSNEEKMTLEKTINK